jgi:hypothetical protein
VRYIITCTGLEGVSRYNKSVESTAYSSPHSYLFDCPLVCVPNTLPAPISSYTRTDNSTLTKLTQPNTYLPLANMCFSPPPFSSPPFSALTLQQQLLHKMGKQVRRVGTNAVTGSLIALNLIDPSGLSHTANMVWHVCRFCKKQIYNRVKYGCTSGKYCTGECGKKAHQQR